jgi:hypothetical protein
MSAATDVETLGMTRHQHQQCIGMMRQQTLMSLKQLDLLALVGAGRDPDRTLRSPTDAASPERLSRDPPADQIELETAHDLNTLARCAQGDEPFGIGRRLGGDERKACQRRARQTRQPRIPARGALRQPRIDQRDRNTALCECGEHVGPDLGLHDDDEPGRDMIEKARHQARQIEGV